MATASAQTVLEKAKRDDLAYVRKSDAAMDAAFGKAKATLKEFLATVRSPRASISSYAVKIPIQDGEATEFFWITAFSEVGGHLVGKISNAPRSVRNVREGQIIKFSENDIVDWLYRENGKMIGNFTACALIAEAPKKEAEEFKKYYGLTCAP